MENFPGSTFWKQMLQMRMKAEDTKLTFCRSKTISGATVEPAANALHVDQVPGRDVLGGDVFSSSPAAQGLLKGLKFESLEGAVQTAAFMQSVDKPLIAYKVLGAGAIHPDQGFRYAYQNGADFLCNGMFDFKVAEDVQIARNALDRTKQRERVAEMKTKPWG